MLLLTARCDKQHEPNHHSTSTSKREGDYCGGALLSMTARTELSVCRERSGRLDFRLVCIYQLDHSTVRPHLGTLLAVPRNQ